MNSKKTLREAIGNLIIEWMFIWFPLLGFILSAGFSWEIFKTGNEIAYIKVLSITIFFSIIGLGVGLTTYNLRREKRELKNLVGEEYNSWPDEKISDLLDNCKKQVCILTTWLPLKELYIGKILSCNQRNINVRVILGSKNVLLQREKELSNYSEKNRFNDNIDLMDKLGDRVKLFDSPPHMLLMIIDHKIFYAPTLFNSQAVEGLVLELDLNSNSGMKLFHNFERIWESI